jgi:uncharacterized membrane protein
MILSVACVAASVPFTFGMEWLNAKRVARERKEGAEKKQAEEGLGESTGTTNARGSDERSQ